MQALCRRAKTVVESSQRQSAEPDQGVAALRSAEQKPVHGARRRAASDCVKLDAVVVYGSAMPLPLPLTGPHELLPLERSARTRSGTGNFAFAPTVCWSREAASATQTGQLPWRHRGPTTRCPSVLACADVGVFLVPRR